MVSDLRVYIVDDSPSARLALGRLLACDGAIEIVGEAADGRRALEDIPRVCPDVVLMDVLMLGLGGLETTRQLMQRHPVPVVLVSDVVGQRARLNFEGLAVGAVDLIRKPSAKEITSTTFARAWARRLRSLAAVPVITRRQQARADSGLELPTGRAPSAVSLVAIGASTGGPRALERLIRQLGPDPAWPVLVIQHIAAGFQPSMCAWLRDSTGARIVTARAGEAPQPGHFYFAPDLRHLSWSGSRLSVSDPVTELPCPSIGGLFSSLARAAIGSRTAAALLTGMGQDGAAGLFELRNAGAWTIAESEESCVIHGMSRVAEEMGGACEVLDLDAIIRRLRGLAYQPHA